ncbi:hypothetical protein COLO4_34921 [Corchorus olitorius]|uniref:Uncharacterized protein n=1 Tax=Corchorus olitorius TaxID=93759 RepID=A0A1R3GIW8_9ROSI|nr:hypothetical protein COLO4_34921 [Corchorus olitorius]
MAAAKDFGRRLLKEERRSGAGFPVALDGDQRQQVFKVISGGNWLGLLILSTTPPTSTATAVPEPEQLADRRRSDLDIFNKWTPILSKSPKTPDTLVAAVSHCVQGVAVSDTDTTQRFSHHNSSFHLHNGVVDGGTTA